MGHRKIRCAVLEYGSLNKTSQKIAKGDQIVANLEMICHLFTLFGLFLGMSQFNGDNIVYKLCIDSSIFASLFASSPMLSRISAVV